MGSAAQECVCGRKIIRNQKSPKKISKAEIVGKNKGIARIPHLLKNKTTIIYLSIFVLIVSVATIGSKNDNSKSEQQLNSASKIESTNVSDDTLKTISTVDEVTETNVIANLAETANLAVAPNAANLSVSMAVLQNSVAETTGVVEKPKILEVASKDREIVTHKAQADESIQAIADKYGITAQTVKWVNNLKGDKIDSEKEIRILPVDGIVYKVKSGDNLEEVAKKYEASLERILSYNGLDDSNSAKENQEIVIPGGVLPEKDRPDYVAPAPVVRTYITPVRTSAGVSQSVSSSSQVIASNYNAKAGNAYAWGNCTWYVYNMRPDIGSFWGNASSWAYSARAAGYAVGSTPKVGAIAQWNAYASGMSGWGHVAYVEAVNADGTVTVSEMNVRGLAVTSRRTIPASSVSNYIY